MRPGLYALARRWGLGCALALTGAALALIVGGAVVATRKIRS